MIYTIGLVGNRMRKFLVITSSPSSSCFWASTCLCLCAMLQIVLSPFLPLLKRARPYISSNIYIGMNYFNIFNAPIVIVFITILILKSRNDRLRWWWGYVGGASSLLIDCATIVFYVLLSGLSRGP